ncbi:MAG: putative PEP-binding protein, partial [Planctomycetota bacterium]
PTLSGDFSKLMKWADEIRRLKIRTNADTPEDAKRARDFGAEGIGLCRTEHMFFGEHRIDYVRQMILTAGNVTRLKTAVHEAETELGQAPKKKQSSLIHKTKNIKIKLKESERLYKGALNKLLPMQRSDFAKIFTVMNGFPVTIRLLDPPLHEFLPKEKHLQIVLARKMGMILKEVKDRVDSLHETNPMLGLRGCRLGIIYPAIYQMQVKAIIEAACAVKKKGIKVVPEIMVPLIGTDEAMNILKKDIKMIANEVLAKKGVKLDYKTGTMIEIPRAALIADRIAKYAEFFSFGTNDLTQMTFGYSRDDVGSFVPQFAELGILEKDPFQVLDQDGVGQLVTYGIKKGRQTKPGLKVGICGEHGGEPSSIQFCHRNGMDYVSCSPFRVPIARLSAAQAVIKENQ